MLTLFLVLDKLFKFNNKTVFHYIYTFVIDRNCYHFIFHYFFWKLRKSKRPFVSWSSKSLLSLVWPIFLFSFIFLFLSSCSSSFCSSIVSPIHYHLVHIIIEMLGYLYFKPKHFNTRIELRRFFFFLIWISIFLSFFEKSFSDASRLHILVVPCLHTNLQSHWNPFFPN